MDFILNHTVSLHHTESICMKVKTELYWIILNHTTDLCNAKMRFLFPKTMLSLAFYIILWGLFHTSQSGLERRSKGQSRKSQTGLCSQDERARLHTCSDSRRESAMSGIKVCPRKKETHSRLTRTKNNQSFVKKTKRIKRLRKTTKGDFLMKMNSQSLEDTIVSCTCFGSTKLGPGKFWVNLFWVQITSSQLNKKKSWNAKCGGRNV